MGKTRSSVALLIEDDTIVDSKGFAHRILFA
jgi:hypothetical protein